MHGRNPDIFQAAKIRRRKVAGLTARSATLICNPTHTHTARSTGTRRHCDPSEASKLLSCTGKIMILSYERTASGGHRVLATPWQLNVSSYLRRPLRRTEDHERACIPPLKLQRCVYRCNQKPAKTQFPSQPASARHSLNDLQNHPTLPPNSTNNHTKHDPLPNPTHASHHPRHRYEVPVCVTPNMSNKSSRSWSIAAANHSKSNRSTAAHGATSHVQYREITPASPRWNAWTALSEEESSSMLRYSGPHVVAQLARRVR